MNVYNSDSYNSFLPFVSSRSPSDTQYAARSVSVTVFATVWNVATTLCKNTSPLQNELA
jgi:hypothetical protein